MRIFECEAVPSKKQPKYISLIVNDNNIEKFWNCVNRKKKVSVPIGHAQEGTIFCSEITPLREIK